jgi:hypothetical protein
VIAPKAIIRMPNISLVSADILATTAGGVCFSISMCRSPFLLFVAELTLYAIDLPVLERGWQIYFGNGGAVKRFRDMFMAPPARRP